LLLRSILHVLDSAILFVFLGDLVYSYQKRVIDDVVADEKLHILMDDLVQRYFIFPATKQGLALLDEVVVFLSIFCFSLL
jgi:hypothetical protein